MAVITKICAKCKRVLGYTDSRGAPGGVSHGLCQKCGHEELVKAGLEPADPTTPRHQRGSLGGDPFGEHRDGLD